MLFSGVYYAVKAKPKTPLLTLRYRHLISSVGAEKDKKHDLAFFSSPFGRGLRRGYYKEIFLLFFRVYFLLYLPLPTLSQRERRKNAKPSFLASPAPL